MGYSIYTIIPNPEGKRIAKALEEEFREAGSLFPDRKGGIDADRSLKVNSHLDYAKSSHKKKGTMIGFNYSCPPTPIREYLYALVGILATKFGNQVLYYDGEATPIFPTEEAARASKKENWIALDPDGLQPKKPGEKRNPLFEMTPKEEATIRAEIHRVRTTLGI